MKNIDFRGMGVALVTPFHSDGEVDYDALARLVDNQLQNGTDYLVVLGTTAETPTLTAEEQKTIVSRVVAQVNGKLPVVLGVGGNNTLAVCQKLQNDDLKGIDAILSVVPYYNKPSQEGIYQHYKCIAEATHLPIILYNVPARTGTNMTAETTLRLARDFENVVAIKEASGNRTQISELLQQKPADFVLLSGDDALALDLIEEGAAGVISVLGNAFPKEFSEMVKLALSGNFEQARSIHEHFTELYHLLFVDGNPAGVKSVLHLLGYLENTLRLPLVPVRKETSEKLREFLKK
jgi:4-hydroxy-tetrahydrodipicolinate synthase